MLIGIFGSARRDGIWHARAQETVVVIFGNVSLDYTQAVIPAGEIAVKVYGLLGSARMRVPRGTAVTLDGANILGSSRVKRLPGAAGVDPREAKPFAVGGVIVLGSVEVEEG